MTEKHVCTVHLYKAAEKAKTQFREVSLQKQSTRRERKKRYTLTTMGLIGIKMRKV